MVQTIYKHKEVLAEIGCPAAISSSGTEYILEMISGQGNLTLLAMTRFWIGFLEMLQLKIISDCTTLLKCFNYIVTQTNLCKESQIWYQTI